MLLLSVTGSAGADLTSCWRTGAGATVLGGGLTVLDGTLTGRGGGAAGRAAGIDIGRVGAAGLLPPKLG